MYLHEYQSKILLKRNNILVPNSFLVTNLLDVSFISIKLFAEKLVLKAQIHSGSRALYGGIIFVDNNYSDLHNNILKLLNNVIVTDQTAGEAKIIKHVLVEEYLYFSDSFYLSLFLDRSRESLCLLFSKKSGSGIETHDQSDFFKFFLDPVFGVCDYHVRMFLEYLNINFSFFDKVKFLLESLFSIFIFYDLILLEINPLVLYNDNFVCLDVKIEFDDNSFFRQSDIFLEYDDTQIDFLEREAKKFNLSYISLDGDIACIVNGAGLAMATMDLIKTNGGYPANFLDIGGDANDDKVLNAVRIITLNKKVSCIFVNIFGGIVKCDSVARSIIKSVDLLRIEMPIVVRFVGNMASEAVDIITMSNRNVFFELDFLKAVEKVVYYSRKKI